MNMTKKLLGSLVGTCLASTLSSSAAVSIIHEYHLGEDGSLGANNVPQASIGSNFTNNLGDFGATSSVQTTGVQAPGSTAYLRGENEAFYGAINTTSNNVAFGIYARASSLTADQTIFMTDGGGNPIKIQTGSNGWGSSVHNIAWVGTANGSNSSFVSDTWVHLALIVRNNSIGFFIDGVDQGNQYDNTSGNAEFNTMHLMTDLGGTLSTRFDGDVDELRVATFDGSADSDAEVIAALQAVPEPSSTALLGLGSLALILRRKK